MTDMSTLKGNIFILECLVNYTATIFSVAMPCQDQKCLITLHACVPFLKMVLI